MIRVTVELVSAISPDRDKVLGVGYIANTGKGDPGNSEYRIGLSKWAPKTKEEWKAGRFQTRSIQLDQDHLSGEVVGFDKEKRGAWDLLFLALRSILSKRNP